VVGAGVWRARHSALSITGTRARGEQANASGAGSRRCESTGGLFAELGCWGWLARLAER
jgi:hypothetical protein